MRGTSACLRPLVSELRAAWLRRRCSPSPSSDGLHLGHRSFLKIVDPSRGQTARTHLFGGRQARAVLMSMACRSLWVKRPLSPGPTTSGGTIPMRTQSHKMRPTVTPSSKPPHFHLFTFAVPLILVLLGLMPAASRLASQSSGDTSAEVHSTNLRPAPMTPVSDSAGGEHKSRFFGFLEFDWDADAPEGVPGFDPWPRSQR